MQCTLALEVNEIDGNEILCPLETFLILSVRRYLSEFPVSIELVQRSGKGPIRLRPEPGFSIKDESLHPWCDCRLPAAQSSIEDGKLSLLSAGLSAVGRRLVAAAPPRSDPPHHPHGLLGFRTVCLQSPNETSVWTKFCEIEIVNATLDIVSAISDRTSRLNNPYSLPETLVKFENHLKQPLRVHNIRKLAQEMAKTTLEDEPKGEKPEVAKIDREKTPRINKKKNKKPKSVNDTDFSVLHHDFAEGPHLTLADVILYPCFHVIFSILKIDKLNDHIPKTITWFKKLKSLKTFESLNSFLDEVVMLTIGNISSSPFDDVEYCVPSNVEEVSLYKCDPTRNKDKRYYTRGENIKAALAFIDDGLEMKFSKIDTSRKIDWSNVPPAANPFGGHLPDTRVVRKTQQLENLAIAVMNMAVEGNRIVDFCSGGGHLGILLAYLLPACSIVLLENKEESLKRAQSRVQILGIKNITFIQCNLDFYIGKFDIGVALHACGISTDLVLENCIKRKAAFVICPCCYGFLHVTDRIQYPRSLEFSNVPIDSYMCIGHSADQTHVDHPMEERGVRCMKIIDSDRAKYAMSNGYSVIISQLEPRNCTPKNMLIIGKYVNM